MDFLGWQLRKIQSSCSCSSAAKKTRFARPDNLPRYLLQGYQLVYDEAGLYLTRGDLILIAAGV